MDLQKFTNSWAGMLAERSFLRIICGVLVVITFIAVSMAATRDTVVTLVPPELSEPAKISMSAADAAYKESWAMFAAGLLGNVTPGTAPFLLENLEMIFSPQTYQKLRSNMAYQLDRIAQDGISIDFQPREVLYETATGRVFVEGKRTISGPTGDKITEDVTYEFDFRITRAKPEITYFDQYVGRPKTQKRLKQQAAQ